MNKYSRSVINQEEEFLFVAPDVPREKHHSKKSEKSSSKSSEHKIKKHKKSHDSKSSKDKHHKSEHSSSDKTSSSHKRSCEEDEFKDNEPKSKKMKSEHEKSHTKSKRNNDEKRSKPSSSSKHHKEDKLAEKTESVKSTSSSSKSSSISPESTSIPTQSLTLSQDWLIQMPKLNLSPDLVTELDNTSTIDYQQAPMYTATAVKPPMPKPGPSESELLTKSISSIKSRTRIFSGNARSRSEVPTLKNQCLRVLTQNLDYVECIGDVPFKVIRPALEKAKPEQLTKIEYYNPYLLDESDILWMAICQRKWRTRQPTEMESWREMYERCNQEDEEKLNRLTKNIRQGQQKSSSCVQRTKMAFVDTTVKGPKRIQVVKKPEVFIPTKKPAVMSLAERIEALKKANPNYVVPDNLLPKVAPSVQVELQQTVKRGPAQRKGSAKAAPMMAKLLNKFRR
ncbi:transcription elongation factor B polypeptide 3-like [Chironomus tepperi]|uniref:transcription elongation factor B polypeptide 3-like n=1 Tax=Chironomus tepperi TaxID=113505 RepID=UPI00391F51CC